MPRSLPRIAGGLQGHERNWLAAIRGETQASCPFAYATTLNETMLLGMVALRAGRPITYDGSAARITDAADAQPADRAVLADLNASVASYTTTVAQARDYNRQQLPIGIAYLNDAEATLRGDALPAVEALVDANTGRAEDEMHGQHPFWLVGLGVAVVGYLAGDWIVKLL